MKKIGLLLLVPALLALACGDSLTGITRSSGEILLAPRSGGSGPHVASTAPADGATNVALTATVTAIFDSEVRCSTVTSASFTVNQSGTPVAGVVSCTGLTAIFTPSANLSPGADYTATVAASVQNLDSASMSADHVWTFTTTTTAGGPTVAVTSPLNGATDVMTDATITADFSEEVRCSTVTSASFTLSDGSPVAGSVECFGTSAAFTPASGMTLGGVYTATVTTAVENLGGEPMAADHVWSFTVEDGPTLAQKMRGIWIIGGCGNVSGTDIIEEIDLYDPVTDTWYGDVAASATGDTYVASSHGMAVYLDGKIYVMGGATDYATLTNRVQVYDIAVNTWTTMTSLPGPRAGAITYTEGDQAYILGGANSVTASNSAGVPTHHRFNPAGAGSWFTTHPTYTTTPTLAVLGTATTTRIGCAFYNFSGNVSHAGGKITTTAHTFRNYNDIYQWSYNAYTSGIAERTLNSARAFMASGGYAGSNGTFFFMAGGVIALTHVANNLFFNFSTMNYVAPGNSFLVYLPPSETATGMLIGANCPSFVTTNSTGVAFHAGVVSPYNGSTAEDPTFYIFGGIKNRTIITTDVSAISANGIVSASSTYTTAGWVAKTAMLRGRFGHSVVAAGP